MTNRKNWTSSWTVLQGSSLLFAKGQGGSTSWVCIPSAPRVQPFFSIPFICVISLLLISAPVFIATCAVKFVILCFLLFFPPSSFSSLKSYYRSGSIPELLLTLLSNWKRSVKPRPAVSYVNCRPMQAAAVCPFSLHVCCMSFILSFTFSVTDW